MNNLTQLAMKPDDLTLAKKAAKRLGYAQTAYTSSSALIGLFCLRDGNDDKKPLGCFIKTEELGILFVCDLSDLGMADLKAME